MIRCQLHLNTVSSDLSSVGFDVVLDQGPAEPISSVQGTRFLTVN